MRALLNLLMFSLLILILQKAQANESLNIYQYAQAGMLSPVVKNMPNRIYVPNGLSNSVSIIDPLTYTVVQTLNTGEGPQHVVPSYDLQTLWVLNNKSNTITAVDPTSNQPGVSVKVTDPYNLYFTPDGKFAIVISEARKELQFRDAKTMKLVKLLPTECDGANHMEFSLDGKFAIVTCEYSGQLMKVNLEKNKIVNYLTLGKPKKIIAPFDPDSFTLVDKGGGKLDILQETKEDKNSGSMPQDIRSSADGRIFFVADMMLDGVVLIDPIHFYKIGFIPTGTGTHAIYPSRDGKLFYVSNRGCHHECGPHGPGSISVLDPVKKKIIANWKIPEGGSPDMGNVSSDGKELWLAGRYDNEVYVFNTDTGTLTHRIPVGDGPHGLVVWPQPGRYSLGHTGNMR